MAVRAAAYVARLLQGKARRRFRPGWTIAPQLTR